jgi:iron complex transport system ATP-binding protein
MLARVLAQDTPVLLLDEPTAALDLRHQLLALQSARMLAARGRTVVAVLHDLNLAARFATRVALMKDGCIAVIARPWEALTPARLEAVFETAVSVVANPVVPRPLVVPEFEAE